jgi:hypothetical protein
VPIVLKSGSLTLLEPSGPDKACNGIALPLPPRKLYEEQSVNGVYFIVVLRNELEWEICYQVKVYRKIRNCVTIFENEICFITRQVMLLVLEIRVVDRGKERVQLMFVTRGVKSANCKTKQF